MSDEAPPKKKPRGMPIPLPSWFLLELGEKSAGLSDQKVTDRVNLRAAAARGEPWDRNTIRNFRRGKFPTLELAEAICAEFDLAMPVFVARSKSEAVALAAIQRLSAPPLAPSPPEPPIAPVAVVVAPPARERAAPMTAEEVAALTVATQARDAKHQSATYDRRLRTLLARKRRGK